MYLRHRPLGQRIPSSPHAVSCSLPTMRDIRGYEEKDPEILQRLKSGYPRFLVHEFSRGLIEHLMASTPGLAGRAIWLASSERMARGLIEHLKREGPPSSGAEPFSSDGLHGISHPASDIDLGIRAKLYLQHIGGFLSSREAEDHLVRLGLLAAPAGEPTFQGDPVAEIRRVLRRAIPECAPSDLLLANSGMNAIYAAFRASAELQAARGRTLWIQLGWLYADTIAILKKFTASPRDYIYIRDPRDMGAITRILSGFGSRIAGVIAEVPTNPLIETPDLEALGGLCRRAGAHLIADPSIVSPFGVDVIPHSDLGVCSLTKYTASEGDVLAGLVAVNPARPDAAELRRRVAGVLEPVYFRDLARLASEIGETEAVLARIQSNTIRVAGHLRAHPKIRDVFWALEPSSRVNFTRIARTPDATGGVISFTVDGPLEAFYDRLRLAKGPSFGMKTSLICPFMYLAHYDLATTPAGIADLAASRLDPDLLRLSIGTEPAEDIIGALEEALG